MNGIEKINNRILSKAKDNAEERINEARREALKIMNESNKLAKQKKESILEEARKEAKIVKERIIAGIKLENKKEKLMARQNIVDDCCCNE